MQLNTELHRSLGCPLALHKVQIYPVTTTAETGDVWHEPPRNSLALLFRLNYKQSTVIY